MVSTRRRISLIAGVAVTACLALPAFATAATRYVDLDTGDDLLGTNDCLTVGTPCKSIGQALVESGTDPDTIEVDDDTYVEAGLTVDGGKTLTGLDFVPADNGATIVDPGSDVNAVITASGGATVSNLTVRNDIARLIEVAGPATVSGNTFDESNTGTNTPHLLILSGAGNPVVTGNTLQKPTSGGVAIRSLSTGSPTISNNTINRYNGSIEVRDGTPLIQGNEILNQTTAGSCDPCTGIRVSNAQATLTANFLHDPIAAAPFMMAIVEQAGGLAASATLTRNVIRGGGVGFNLSVQGGAIGPVMLSGDTITGYAIRALEVQNTGGATISATNVTFASSQLGVTEDVLLNNAQLSLDSSILFNAGIATFSTASCSIAFSRGPTALPGGNGCADFQTTADPLLAGATDAHLLLGSPMIDAGNPTAPAPGTVDIDGDDRALDGILDCTNAPRRDIGADEFVPAPTPPDCDPPNTVITSGPSGTTSDNTPTFAFVSTESLSTFRCAIDAASFTSCTSLFTTPPLSNGPHLFRVKAVDSSLNEDLTPATRSFTVDTTAPPPPPLDTSAPDTSVSGKKKIMTRKKKARITFTFGASEAGSTFVCSLDGRPFSPCSSPFSAKVRRGAHTLSVVATDAAGNVDPTPASFTTRVKRKR
jgi:hypothetical protein